MMGDDQLAVLTIAANSFCHQMVRSVAGFSTEVGRGRVEPAAVPDIIEKRDRSAARRVAPPHGLTLWQVGYEEWPNE